MKFKLLYMYEEWLKMTSRICKLSTAVVLQNNIHFKYKICKTNKKC